MARFKFLGEPPNGFVDDPGKTIRIRLPRKNGGAQEITPVPPATEFVVGQDIGYDITDERSLRALRADTRYEEII